MASTAALTDAPYLLEQDEGLMYHFLNHLATVKVQGGAGNALSVVEFVGPKGFGPPLHSHRDEDELFVVLEGHMVFRSGDVEVEGHEGAHAFLPHGMPHQFQVLSDTARFTCVTASLQGAPRFDAMVTALGEITDRPELPTPGPIDAANVAEVNARFGIDILGPPPAPLD